MLRWAVARAQQCAAEQPADYLYPSGALSLAPAEVRAALDDLLMADSPASGLDVLLESGALRELLPEVAVLEGFGDGEWRHKDVWKHTKQVVEQSVPRLAVRWAALLHDIGKVRTRSVTADGEVHFIGHAEVGARMFDKLARRQGWFSSDAALRSKVKFLIRHHLRASQYDGSWTDSAVRRFAREMGEHLDDLLCLSRADITTKRPHKRSHGIAMIDELAERISQLAAEDAVVAPLPTGLGDDIMQAFAIPPSRLIGDIKRELEAAVEAGEIEPHRDGAYYVTFVAANRTRFGLERSPT